MIKVCVIVCASGRPDLLRRCLRSLGALILDADIDLEIVVIDSARGIGNRAVAAEFRRSPFQPIRYVQSHSTRNAAKLVAMEMMAAWMVYIDDDQTADPEWLMRLHSEYLSSKSLPPRLLAREHRGTIPQCTHSAPTSKKAAFR
jgi:succinoglycan biosynthesis protein ExoM